MQFLAVIPVLVLSALTAWASIVVVAARARQFPPRLSALKALFLLGRAGPRDMGFAATPFQFTSNAYGRPVQLAGWFVPHPDASGRLVLIIHGYADSSAGACAWLPMLHRAGVNVLLVDMPGHGESGDSTCTGGWLERHCIWDIIDQFRVTNPADAQRVILYGLSMGAAIVLAAARLRPGINGIIVDSPYADFQSATVRHARLFGMPATLIQRPANWFVARKYGIVFEDIAPMRLLDFVDCPILLIQSGNDLLISPYQRSQMEARVHSIPGGQTLTVANAPHLLGLSRSPEQYEAAVYSFLSPL